MALIYLLDSDINSRKTLNTYLKLSDYNVELFVRSEELFESIKKQKPDLIILEVVSPYFDGFFVSKKLLQLNIPFMFVTERGEESDRIIGFEMGAEEYIVKPYSPKETVLRVAKVLRLIQRAQNKIDRILYTLGEETLGIEHSSHKAFINEKEINLTSTEWKVLQYLIANEQVSVAREKLLKECLDFHFNGYKRTIDTHVKKLRAKLGDPRWIKTDRGYGYRFVGKQIKIE